MRVLIFGYGEEPAILSEFLKEKGIEVNLFKKFDFKVLSENSADVIIVDENYKIPDYSDYDAIITAIKEKLPQVEIYGMSSIDSDNMELPVHEDGHLYKPLGRKDLEIFYRALNNLGKKELVCMFLGLRFYSSPENARLLKSRVTDVLLNYFSDENLVGIDLKPTPVNLTPSFSKIYGKKKKKSNKQKEPL